MNKNDLERIARYIDGKADENERAWVESLLLDGEDNLTLRSLIEKDWDNILSDKSISEANLISLLDRIHHQIRRNEFQKRRSVLKRITRIYTKAAAVLLLPLVIGGALLGSYVVVHMNTAAEQPVVSTIIAPLGSRISFNLPDGSKGMLNSGSKLSYNLPFNGNRSVKLKGEAWLEVNHDENHPFKISAGNSLVNVVGTSFNICAYPDENYIEVVLQNGIVEFKENEFSGTETLHPSERMICKNGEIRKSFTDPLKYNAWTEGKLVFRGDPMAEVARRMERWYNVKVNLADKALEKYSFRGIFIDDSLEDVLRFLSMTSPIRYWITPRELMTDGTYKKEEVTIYLKK